MSDKIFKSLIYILIMPLIDFNILQASTEITSDSFTSIDSLISTWFGLAFNEITFNRISMSGLTFLDDPLLVRHIVSSVNLHALSIGG